MAFVALIGMFVISVDIESKYVLRDFGSCFRKFNMACISISGNRRCLAFRGKYFCFWNSAAQPRVNYSTIVSAYDRRIFIDNGRKFRRIHKHLSKCFPPYMQRWISIYNWTVRHCNEYICNTRGTWIFDHRHERQSFRAENGETHAHVATFARFSVFKEVTLASDYNWQFS